MVTPDQGLARLHFRFQAWTNDDDAHLAAWDHPRLALAKKNCKKLVSQRAIRQLSHLLQVFWREVVRKLMTTGQI